MGRTFDLGEEKNQALVLPEHFLILRHLLFCVVQLRALTVKSQPSHSCGVEGLLLGFALAQMPL